MSIVSEKVFLRDFFPSRPGPTITPPTFFSFPTALLISSSVGSSFPYSDSIILDIILSERSLLTYLASPTGTGLAPLVCKSNLALGSADRTKPNLRPAIFSNKLFPNTLLLTPETCLPIETFFGLTSEGTSVFLDNKLLRN